MTLMAGTRPDPSYWIQKLDLSGGFRLAFWISGVVIQPAQRLRKIEHIPRTYQKDSVAVYEGNPFIWGTWGMFLGVCWNLFRGT